ncbi:MAG TPA: GTPase, partial [Blastocatellia bacterium]|nr:GTPase [Blastocatellia bacterium]
APLEGIETVRRNAEKVNPRATIINADMRLTVEDPSLIEGKRILVVEDGPTLTHGGMKYGAGIIAARAHRAAEIVDPRPYAVGEIAATFRAYPNTGPLLPAMGYGEQQVKDLSATIEATPCDLVLVATPIDLRRVVNINKPTLRVGYELVEKGELTLAKVVSAFLEKHS